MDEDGSSFWNPFAVWCTAHRCGPYYFPRTSFVGDALVWFRGEITFDQEVNLFVKFCWLTILWWIKLIFKWKFFSSDRVKLVLSVGILNFRKCILYLA